MKAITAIVSLTALLMSVTALAEELQVGRQTSKLAFEDAGEKRHSMARWEGNLLLINDVDPDESNLNEPFTDAMRRAKEAGLLKDESYKGIGTADFAATRKPNFAIRA